MYDEAEDNVSVVESAQINLTASRRVSTDIHQNKPEPQQKAPPAQHAGGHNLVDRKAHGMGMRLKDSGKKFSGDLGECWMSYVDEDQQVAADYNLGPRKNAEYS